MAARTTAREAFVAVVSWSDARRKEREAYYRSETLKKIAETQGGGSVLELVREERKQAAIRRREGLKLGGLVNIAVGAGVMLFLAALIRNEPETTPLVYLPTSRSSSRARR